METEQFAHDYNQFFPLMSVFRFGSDFTANNVGSAASLSGNDTPEINRAYATSGPEPFPINDLEFVAEALNFPADDKWLDVGTGGISIAGVKAGIALEGQETRFGQFYKNVSIGTLAIVLIAVGVIYLGLTSYLKVSGGGSVVSAVTGAVTGD